MDVYFNTILFVLITSGVFIFIDIVNHINITDSLLGALLGAGLISLIVFITKGMGTGDIEIALAVASIFAMLYGSNLINLYIKWLVQ